VKPYRILFTAAAAADLRDIVEYVGEDNPEAASRVAIQLIAACGR
jgi:plasmid stabilization system protein ParE